MEIGAFLSFTFALFILAIKPGPGIFTFVVQTMRHGLWNGYGYALGLVTGESAYFLLAAGGFALIPDLQLFLQILCQSIGAVLLIWLGIKGLQDSTSDIQPADHDKKAKGFIAGYLIGLMITLGNPLAMIFYLSFVPAFFGNFIGHPELFLIGIGAIALVNIPLYFTAGWALMRFGNFMKNPTLVRRMNIASSLLMIGLGLFIGITTLPIFNWQQFLSF
jgi:threonine/homoserine/homoserine lactone efflux protein